MAVEHPHTLISAPADPTEKAWRYMDFSKFVSLISRRELYFCNLEVLAKNDPHEGLLSQPNYQHRKWKTIADLTAEEHAQVFFKPMAGEEERIQFESTRNSKEFWLRRRFYDRRTLMINCWHINNYESASMWTQYAPGGQGIAITSNFSKIIDSLKSAKQRVFAGLVKYLDWNNQAVDNSFVLPFSKRQSFSYENELRLIYWDNDVQEKVNALCAKLCSHMMDHLYRRIHTEIRWDMIEKDVENISYENGIYIPVDIDTLISEIYVSPNAPDWFLDVVNVVCKKFDLERLAIRSDITSAPIR